MMTAFCFLNLDFVYLQLRGLNALFGLKIQICLGENMIAALAVSDDVSFVQFVYNVTSAEMTFLRAQSLE